MDSNIFFSSKKTPFTVIGLEPNTEYDFTIRVVDNLENFDTWKNVKFKTLPPLPLITDVTITPIYPASYNADVKFKCYSLAVLKTVTVFDNSNPIQMFENPIIDADGFITVRLNSLQELTTYNMNIRVTDEYGQIGISDIYSYRTTSVPPIIASVRVLRSDKYNIDVYVDVNSTVGIKNYKYIYNGITVTTENNPYRCSNLEEDTEYVIKITVFDIYDQTAEYTLVAKTSGDGPTINEVLLTNLTINSVDITVDATPIIDIVQYVYTINNKVYKTDEKYYHVSGLTPYTLYNVNVDVFDRFGLYTSKNVSFRTKSDGVDINTITISDILYTEFSVSITYNKFVEISKIELLGTDQDGKTYDFGIYDNSSFAVQNVYPNNSYHLGYTITDITGVVTVYEQEERVTMLHSELRIDSATIDDIGKYEASLSILYTMNTDFKCFEIEFNDGTKVNIYNDVYILQNLKQNTDYTIKVVLIDSFDRRSNTVDISFKTLINYIYVSFNTGEGTPLETIMIEESKSFSLDDYISSRTGYTFSGWYIGDVKYSGVYTVGKEDVVFDSHWDIIIYTVTFVYFDEIQDKDVSIKVLVEYLQSAVAPDVTPKTGYNFVGWDKEIINVTSDFTANAIYSPINYVVTLSTSGGITPTQELAFTYDKSIGTLPIPNLLGATFIKWNSKSDGSGTNIVSDMIWKITDIDTIYAIYKAYNVTYNTDGGVLSNKISVLPVFMMSYNITSESTGSLTSGPNGYVLTATTGTKHQLVSSNISGLSNKKMVLLYEFVNKSVYVSRMWYQYDNDSEIIEMNPFRSMDMPTIPEESVGNIYMEVTLPNIGEYIINTMTLYELESMKSIVSYIHGVSMEQLPYATKSMNTFTLWKTVGGNVVSDHNIYTWDSDITLNANYISDEYTIDFNLNNGG